MPRSDLEPDDGAAQEQPDGGKRVVADSYSGPLPPPRWMDRYEQTMLGRARIMAMAANEQAHGHEIEMGPRAL